ncbi:MAG: CoA transferase [Acetobacteraceae bacterium]|nr:CoA transferase [Acetobacteraceae bacterium]
MAPPLSGLLVVALEQAVAAPLCTGRLAEGGARVIKIERPGGDFARGYDTAAGGLSSYFVWCNRGKESVVLDLKAAEDRALLARILARADVFVQNLAPGAAERLGFGSAALRARHPRLITVDISGYGEAPELAQRKAYDLLVQAEAGLAAITGHPAGPGRVGVSVADIACGMNAHAAVLEALIARERTGRGAGIAVSLFDSLADWMNVPLLFLEGTGRAPARVGLAHPSICPYGAFPLADGASVLIGIQNEREWAAFCALALGRPEWPAREGFRSNAERVANRALVDGEIAAILGGWTRAEAEARLAAAGTAFGFVNEVADLARHPALRRVSVPLPEGWVSLAAPPVRWRGEARQAGAVPALGQHTAAVRAEFAA